MVNYYKSVNENYVPVYVDTQLLSYVRVDR